MRLSEAQSRSRCGVAVRILKLGTATEAELTLRVWQDGFAQVCIDDRWHNETHRNDLDAFDDYLPIDPR